MDDTTRTQILNLIIDKVKKKLKSIKKTSEHSPFFEPLFTKSMLLQTSIMHSFYTSFGTVYEEIAEILAQANGYQVKRQYKLAGAIDAETEGFIAQLMQRPATKTADIEQIRQHIQSAPQEAVDRDKVVDVYIQRPDGVEMLFDITTVKPSKKEFVVMRLKMLRWCALRFSTNRNAKIETYIGIPFNPDYPNAYKRWTAKQLDVSEVLIQNDLWAKFAGYDVFPDLEEIFKDAGDLMRAEVQTYLDKLKQSP